MSSYHRPRRTISAPKIGLADIPVRKSLPLPTVMAERIVWESRASQLENVRDFFTAGLASTVIALAGIYLDDVFFLMLLPLVLAACVRWFEVRCKHYKLTEERLHIRTGIIKRSRRSLELLNVANVVIKVPVIQRLLGCGTIRITSCQAGDPPMTLFAISRPEEVYRALLKHIAQQNPIEQEESGEAVPAG